MGAGRESSFCTTNFGNIQTYVCAGCFETSNMCGHEDGKVSSGFSRSSEVAFCRVTPRSLPVVCRESARLIRGRNIPAAVTKVPSAGWWCGRIQGPFIGGRLVRWGIAADWPHQIWGPRGPSSAITWPTSLAGPGSGVVSISRHQPATHRNCYT